MLIQFKLSDTDWKEAAQLQLVSFSTQMLKDSTFSRQKSTLLSNQQKVITP
jgi:hypothetical protein